MIHTDGENTISNHARPTRVSTKSWIAPAVEASFPQDERLSAAQGFHNTLAEIQALPERESTRDWQDADPNRWNLH